MLLGYSCRPHADLCDFINRALQCLLARTGLQHFPAPRDAYAAKTVQMITGVPALPQAGSAAPISMPGGARAGSAGTPPGGHAWRARGCAAPPPAACSRPRLRTQRSAPSDSRTGTLVHCLVCQLACRRMPYSGSYAARSRLCLRAKQSVLSLSRSIALILMPCARNGVPMAVSLWEPCKMLMSRALAQPAEPL